jgi:hypothetical protein
MKDTKSEIQGKLTDFGDRDVLLWGLSSVTNGPLWFRMQTQRETLHVW